MKRGYSVSPVSIEQYEYFNDKKRLDILQKHQDTYLYEQGSMEFNKSYKDTYPTGISEDDSNVENNKCWVYDMVVQAQFKHEHAAKSSCQTINDLLNSDTSVLQKWSISINKHGLTHPGNLYVKGIPKDLTIDDLIPVFSTFGNIIAMKIISDSTTGASLGYGFLSYQLGSQASACISKLNGKVMNGSTLFINYHVERKERERIYWDHFKENTDNKRFRGIFIGNLPIQDEKNALITPEQVVDKFKEVLNSTVSTDAIVSFYFPKQNSNTDLEYVEEEAMNGVDTNAETCPSQHEDWPLKGYGFMKFLSHEHAINAIEKFTAYEWLGSKLNVNKAIQNKPHHIYTDKNVIGRNMKNLGYQYYVPYGVSQSAYPAYHSGISHGVKAPQFMGYMSRPGSYSSKDLESAVSSDFDPQYTNDAPSRSGEYIDNYNYYSRGTTPNPDMPSYAGENGSIFNMSHCMNSDHNLKFWLPRPMRDQQESNIYVKHIPFSWRDDDLFDFYKKFGEVISAKVITVGGSKNKDTKNDLKTPEVHLGTSKGYGFVYFKNPLDAARAISQTDRYKVNRDHTLHVSFAQKRSRLIDENIDSGSNTSVEQFNNYNHGYDYNASYYGNGFRRVSCNEHTSSYNKYTNPIRRHHRHCVGNYTASPPNYITNGNNWNMHMMPSATPINMSPPNFIPPIPPINVPYMIQQQYMVNNVNVEGNEYSYIQD